MKKIITIVVIIFVLLGLGYYLYSISEQQAQPIGRDTFDISGATELSQPNPVSAEDHVLGNPDAKNTFIVYGDFQCPACRSFESTVQKVLTDFPDTRIVFRHFPLLTSHKNAAYAAFASESAAAQGKFWEMHDALYERQADWSNKDDPTEVFVDIARGAGVANMDQFRDDLVNKKHKPRVQRDYVESIGLKVSATPTIYFNNQKLEPRVDVNAIKQQAEPYFVK